ncbi:MAG: DUF433 domain-containing protein [Candidatus Dormibacteria bacterium]
MHTESVPFARVGCRFTSDFEDLVGWLATTTVWTKHEAMFDDPADLVTIDPAICHGKPCVRGTRKLSPNEWCTSR